MILIRVLTELNKRREKDIEQKEREVKGKSEMMGRGKEGYRKEESGEGKTGKEGKMKKYYRTGEER